MNETVLDATGGPVRHFEVDKKDVGRRIRILRESKALTQKQLSMLCGGKSRSAIAQWENGNALPDLSDFMALAFYLNSTPAYIAFGINSNNADSVSVPVVRYQSGEGEQVGEMALDVETVRRLNRPASARLRAVRSDRNEMMDGLTKGDMIVIDEADRVILGGGEPYLIVGATAAVAYITAIPGQEKLMVRVNGQVVHMDPATIPVAGRVVATLNLFS